MFLIGFVFNFFFWRGGAWSKSEKLKIDRVLFDTVDRFLKKNLGHGR